MSEIPTVCNQTTPIAKKEHKCFECRGVIEPGEKYHRTWGVWNGEVSKFKTCDDCETLRHLMGKDRDLDEWPCFGGLLEDVEESDVPEWNIAMRNIFLKRKLTVPEWLNERIENRDEVVA